MKLTRAEVIKTLGYFTAGLPFINAKTDQMNLPDFNSYSGACNVSDDPILKAALSELEYLTPSDKFIVQRRGEPVLSEIPDDKLASIGLTRDTWRLEITTDTESNSELGNPLTNDRGNAFTFKDLINLSGKNKVRYLHVLACTNSTRLYGMGLWEGVPLRDVLWMADPKQNIRRIYYYGYHNNQPSQLFQSSIHISRVMEEAPGELPVILCYKLNGKWISHANGGPVRLFIPGYYGNRSIKWLQKIIVTNSFHANDTYADGNNDVEGPVKTVARFIKVPEKVKAREPFAVTGLAQVGHSGLKKVQYWLKPAQEQIPKDDLYLANADWKDATILPPPEKWGSDLPEGKLPPVMQTNPATGKPYTWPIINTIVHWAVLLKTDSSGEFEIRCRTIDGNGIAQPLPRPFGRSGVNRIEVARISAV